MNSCRASFVTTGFIDDDAAQQERVNEGIGGYALSVWVSNELRKKNFDVTDPWHEDHGCDFYIRRDGQRYLCVCSIEEDGAVERIGHVTAFHERTIFDKLMGRNKVSSEVELSTVIFDLLSKHPNVSQLTRE
jgi:hypothetical protein